MEVRMLIQKTRSVRTAMCWNQYYTYLSCGNTKVFGGFLPCFKPGCSKIIEKNQDLRHDCGNCGRCGKGSKMETIEATNSNLWKQKCDRADRGCGDKEGISDSGIWYKKEFDVLPGILSYQYIARYNCPLFATYYCFPSFAKYLLPFNLKPPRTHKMKAYLSAAISYLMILKLEVSLVFHTEEITNNVTSPGTPCISGRRMNKQWG